MRVDVAGVHCLLQVNGEDLRAATHEKAILCLTQSTSELQLVVRHDPQPDGLQVGQTVAAWLHSGLRLCVYSMLRWPLYLVKKGRRNSVFHGFSCRLCARDW